MTNPNLSIGLRLQVIRSVLFMQPGDVASMFPGMTTEQWSAIESGDAEATEHIIKKIEALFTWRNHQLAMTRQMLAANPKCVLSEFWHATMDDWMAIDEREPQHFRASQSLVAALATEHPTQFKLFSFDLVAFVLWANGRPATDELQSQYLSIVSEPTFNAFP